MVSNKRWGSVTFAEVQRLESVSQSSLEACLFSLWMMSGLLSQLKHDSFNPSDPTYFNTAISSVSAAFASQAHSAAVVSTLLSSKWRESLLAHATVPVSQVQKRELTVAPGSSDGLFDQDLLEKVASQVKEDAFVSSYMSMAKLAQSGSSGKTGRHAASRYPFCFRIWFLRLPVLAFFWWVFGQALGLSCSGWRGQALPRRLLLPNLRVSGSRSHIHV